VRAPVEAELAARYCSSDVKAPEILGNSGQRLQGKKANLTVSILHANKKYKRGLGPEGKRVSIKGGIWSELKKTVRRKTTYRGKRVDNCGQNLGGEENPGVKTKQGGTSNTRFVSAAKKDKMRTVTGQPDGGDQNLRWGDSKADRTAKNFFIHH